jgi:signal transduction histidine kinase
MLVIDCAPVSVDRRQNWLSIQRLICASYVIDVLVLESFVLAGVAPWWLPLTYGAAGLGYSCVFYTLIGSGYSSRFADANLTLAQLITAVLIEVSFMWLAPAAALYFIAIVFMILSFACLRIRLREAILAWTMVIAAVVIALLTVPRGSLLFAAPAPQRLALSVGLLLALTRCILVGLYGTRARTQLLDRHRRALADLKHLEGRGAAIYTLLHEDLGQQLAGVSLILAAAENRLNREDHPVAEDIQVAARHLRNSIAKVRTIAYNCDPAKQ